MRKALDISIPKMAGYICFNEFLSMLIYLLALDLILNCPLIWVRCPSTFFLILCKGFAVNLPFEFPQLFTGNYRFQNLIVMNVLPVPVQTQFLRINPITYGYQSSVKCLRAEVYGYHPGMFFFILLDFSNWHI